MEGRASWQGPQLLETSLETERRGKLPSYSLLPTLHLPVVDARGQKARKGGSLRWKAEQAGKSTDRQGMGTFNKVYRMETV